MNVPSKWAKWKLGYGPGSAEEFSKEESIFNSVDPRQSTKRVERHEKKLKKKQKRVFIPLRCECPGCDKHGDDMKKCSRCRAVSYCGREHQTKDFSRHKLECKYLSKRNDLEFKHFSTPKELEAFPLGSSPKVANETRCCVCHCHAEEVNLGRTSCCNLPTCDNAHEYEINSYSRDHCMRSHMMYTKCYDHHEQGHEGDWRECTICNTMNHNNVRPFSTTNGFNYSPTLEENLHRGSFLTEPCSGCDNRILPGHDGSTYSGGSVFCSGCM